MRSIHSDGAAAPVRADRSRRPAESPVASPAALRIAVVGTGYVGLVTAACMARFGHQVTAIDIDDDKVQELQRGQVTIHEEGLAALVQEQLAAKRLTFVNDAFHALPQADIIFIAVGTPARNDGSTCMDAVDKVVSQIAGLKIGTPAVVVLKSTVPVGTARRVQAALGEPHRSDQSTPCVLSNPEFLREGSAVHDFLQPDRIVIGGDGDCDAARQRLLLAYRPLTEQGVPVLAMDTCSAELAKCAANAMLATRISFVNEIASIAAATGADIQRVCEGIGSDKRIGSQFLQAGVGYGGSCFPKDVAALRHTARQHSLRSDMLRATERVNGRQRSWAFDALQRDVGGSAAMRGMRVAVWGLAFKPGTDDMREAPSLALIERLCRAGVFLQLYDPVAMARARAVVPADRRLSWATSAAASLQNADALMLVTEWQEFVAFDPKAVAETLRLRVVYDGRNALDQARWAAAGLRVVQVGRPEAGRRPMAARELAMAELSINAQPLPAVSPPHIAPHAALAAALR